MKVRQTYTLSPEVFDKFRRVFIYKYSLGEKVKRSKLIEEAILLLYDKIITKKQE